MRQEFVIKSKPFSINSATYKDASIKTADYREWSYRIFNQLNSQENLDKMKQLREAFDDQKHSIALEITAIYPRSVFITKDGILSSRTIDTTNHEKLLTDLLFDARYFDKPVPYGVKNICVNDKFITEMVSKKKFHDSEDHVIEVAVSLIPRSF